MGKPVILGWLDHKPKSIKIHSAIRRVFLELQKHPNKWGLIKITTTFNRANCFQRKNTVLAHDSRFKFVVRQRDIKEFHVYGCFTPSARGM